MPVPITNITPLPAPTPVRALGSEGRRLWEAVWGLHKGWIDRQTDIEIVQLLCETHDERAQLRRQVFLDEDWRKRTALRSVDAQISDLMSKLGLDPTARKALSVATQDAKGKLAELRAARQ